MKKQPDQNPHYTTNSILSISVVLKCLILFLLASTPGEGQILTTLVNFTNNAYPNALLQGSDGNFYGTTQLGGSSLYGTVFKMTPDGALTTLANFDWYTNGAEPSAPLVQASNGIFYGTTSYGGPSGYGTVFKMTPDGALTTLVSFGGGNGEEPLTALVKGTDGNFYGTTLYGGSGGGNIGTGTIFKMTPAGALTTLVSFNSTPPTSLSDTVNALVQGTGGYFYGTTEFGGPAGLGTIFKMTPSGVLTTLVNFNMTNGAYPTAALVQGSDGNFYGTTQLGGSSSNGTAFKITPGGTFTTLVNFNSTNGYPYGGLVQGIDRNFYGTSTSGGSSGDGTVFKMTPGGTLTTLLSFNSTTGANPEAALVQGSDGNFYGTTASGGPGGGGTIFKVSFPAPPLLSSPVYLGAGGFQFSFTNGSAASFTVLASSDLSLPASNWTVLGVPAQVSPGQFQFTDPQATNNSTRFYQLRSQ